jgi:hypothetical protein
MAWGNCATTQRESPSKRESFCPLLVTGIVLGFIDERPMTATLLEANHLRGLNCLIPEGVSAERGETIRARNDHQVSPRELMTKISESTYRHRHSHKGRTLESSLAVPDENS